MVMRFTPLGNATSPCSGLEDRAQSRLAMAPASFYGVSVGLFGAYTVLLVLALVGVVWTRNHPRFAKVRPLPLSLSALLAAWLYVSGGTIAIAREWPCAYIIAAQFVGVGVIATTLMMRLVVLTLEAHYAKLASTVGGVMLGKGDLDVDSVVADTDGGRASFISQSSLGFIKHQYAATGVLFRLVNRNTPLAELTLHEVVMAKSAYFVFAYLYFSPALYTALVLIFVVPPVYQCPTQCHELFLEAEIGLMLLFAYFMVFDGLMMHTAHTAIGWDNKGVLKEMGGTVFGAASVGLVAMGFSIADPSDLDFNRVFNWQVFIVFLGFLHLWVTFGVQLLVAYLQNRRIQREDKQAATTAVVRQMAHILAHNPEVKREFEQFAVKHYVSESVQFLDDVAQFKHLYYDKTESWRAQKVRILVKNYVVVGSNLEVNISSAARGRILERAGGESASSSESFDLFDVAVVQVREMLQSGVWRSFIRDRDLSSLGSGLAPSTPLMPRAVVQHMGSFRV